MSNLSCSSSHALSLELAACLLVNDVSRKESPPRIEVSEVAKFGIFLNQQNNYYSDSILETSSTGRHAANSRLKVRPQLELKFDISSAGSNTRAQFSFPFQVYFQLEI